MLSSSYSHPLPTAEHPPRGGVGTTISAVPHDVVRSHIIPCLDGASVAALSSASVELHSLCTDEHIWRDKCIATWRSFLDPRVQRVISTLPSGHRSFFSDSYTHLGLRRGLVDLPPSVATKELISAVDIYYKGEVIFSKVQETETVSGWFLCSPFRVDLLDPKESVSTRIPYNDQWDEETWVRNAEENLSLSWILIDPTRKRAANVSSRRPVSVHRHWLTGEVHVRFSTVLAGNRKRKSSSSSELVEFATEMVMAPEASAVEVREVSLVAEDMEGKNLGGEGSLVILTAAMGGGRRRGGGEERYRELEQRKREAREEKGRRRSSKAVDTAACVVAGGAAVVVSFWLCLYLCIRQKLVVIVNKLK
ncbi:PREDICTED: F-box protein At3g44326 [Tarenaya hassleriana]|uniref:F-box protein At3g44326 n=1 Tax=Tarenaya hassleriana TaxID=28532 RepID=UPI00053C3655|nr:PREDICTED: F-box protein At3g44326 [Tarenaya hassleriana]